MPAPRGRRVLARRACICGVEKPVKVVTPRVKLCREMRTHDCYNSIAGFLLGLPGDCKKVAFRWPAPDADNISDDTVADVTIADVTNAISDDADFTIADDIADDTITDDIADDIADDTITDAIADDTVTDADAIADASIADVIVAGVTTPEFRTRVVAALDACGGKRGGRRGARRKRLLSMLRVIDTVH